jgi:hypothetical protein
MATAYKRALADYNEQVAAAQIQAGVQIQGRNPELNREIFLCCLKGNNNNNSEI